MNVFEMVTSFAITKKIVAFAIPITEFCTCHHPTIFWPNGIHRLIAISKKDRNLDQRSFDPYWGEPGKAHYRPDIGLWLGLMISPFLFKKNVSPTKYHTLLLKLCRTLLLSGERMMLLHLQIFIQGILGIDFFRIYFGPLPSQICWMYKFWKNLATTGGVLCLDFLVIIRVSTVRPWRGLTTMKYKV